MKAELIVAGWFLMYPPIVNVDSKWTAEPYKPYSQWEYSKAFDTAKECEAERAHWQQWIMKPGEHVGGTATKKTKVSLEGQMWAKYMYARCIPTDLITKEEK
jgi:hypothetical protein